MGFALGPYDASRPLMIDPVLVYSTYLGGSGADQGHGIAVDGLGQAYVTGFTESANFPTVNPLPPPNNVAQGNQDIFVSKLSAAGNALVYSTYLGGSGFDEGRGITVDEQGQGYVTGVTFSANFPTVNPLPAGGALQGNFDETAKSRCASLTALSESTS